MTVQTKPLAELTHQAMDVLARELGVADAARFINQFTMGHGNYTVERDTLFSHMTLDQIVAQIKASASTPTTS